MTRRIKILAAVVLAFLIAGVWIRVQTARSSEEEIRDSIASITQTVQRRALQCYVIEGAYPESLSYLEENYGLTVNHEDYLIVYDAFAENLPPEVRVKYKK